MKAARDATRAIIDGPNNGPEHGIVNRKEVGRRRLAMRLPQMRSRIMSARRPWQLQMFEAYELAVETREFMRFNPSEEILFEEYVTACLEIERDVVRSMRDDRLES
jgi:hypothetical protein